MKLPRLTLAEKLNLAFVAVFSVPLLGLALFLGWKFGLDLQEKDEASTLARLEKTVAVVGRKMEVLESTSAFLVGYQELVEYTARPQAPTAEDLLRVKELLVTVDRIQTLNPDIVRTRLFVSNPNWPEIWPFLFSENRITGTPWYAAVAQGQTKWRIGHWDDLTFLTDTMSGKDFMVSLFKPVEGPYGDPRGELQVSTTVSAFFDGLFEGPGGTPTAALWEPQKGPPRDPWRRPLPPTLAGAPGRIGVQTTSEGLLPGVNGGASVAWIKVPQLGIVLLTEVPRTSSSTLPSLLWALTLGTLAILVLAALAFSLGTRMVLRRLDTVTAAVQKVRQGQWDVDLPVTGNDEVADLAQTFKDLLERLKGLVDGLVREQMATKDAEIRALQSQINAHFLYNVLEAIRMTAFVDGQDRVADALAALGRSLRYGMEWERPVVSLKDEVAHVEAYILLWNLRFGGTLRWETRVPPGWEDVKICKFTLQPLVENAVVHGLASRGHQGTIRLEGTPMGGAVILRLADDGSGADEHRWAELRRNLEGTGQPTDPRAPIGLANVHERLRKTFGPGSGLVLEGTKDGWTTVTIKLSQEEPRS